MGNINLSYLKNITITGIASMATAAGASEITGYFSDNGKVMGLVGAIAQWPVSAAVFLGLQARTNREFYTLSNGDFNTREFFRDNVKFGLGVVFLELAYLTGRPLLQDYFIDKGITPARSSVTTDTILLPLYGLSGIGLAKITGLFRNKKAESKLEEEVKK